MRKRYFLASIFFLLNSSFSLSHSILSETQNKNDNISQTKLDPSYLNFSPKTDYIIGPGDVLNIVISREYPELTAASQLVDGEGTIYLSRLNRVYVLGLTLNELNQILNEAYKKFVKYPSVEVTVNDDFAISYNLYESVKHLHSAGTAVEQETKSINLAYTVGGLTLAFADAKTDNAAYSAGASDDTRTLSVKTAF